MGEEQKPSVVRPSERSRRPQGQTPGLSREEAFATDFLWAGVLTTTPGEMSSWHHHGDHETYAYVLSGRKRIEYGPGGNEVLEARPGDFIHLPTRLVHREGNPDAEPSELIVFRVGSGSPVVNVDGPE
jgi:uncharacterized RmlC-like cupin family protein